MADTIRECEKLTNKLREDKSWQRGFDEAEIDYCMMFASSMLRYTSRQAQNLPRQYAVVLAMLSARPVSLRASVDVVTPNVAQVSLL